MDLRNEIDRAPKKEVTMSRLIRLDASGHTTLAEWSTGDDAAQQRAIDAFEAELEKGMIASATLENTVPARVVLCRPGP